MDLAALNRCRFRPGHPGGPYGSYLQRVNHPHRPLAFWIRYTVFRLGKRDRELSGGTGQPR
jgi:hypothetical protein